MGSFGYVMLCLLNVSARKRINIHDMLLRSIAFLDLNFLGIAKFSNDLGVKTFAAFSAIIKSIEIVYLCFWGVKVRLAPAPLVGEPLAKQTLI